MKKLVLVLALVAFLGAGTAFADFGIGVHVGGAGGLGDLGYGGGLNLAFSNIYIYIDTAFRGSSLGVSGAVDFVSFLNIDIVDTLSFYLRLGIPVSIWGFGSDFGLAAGVRVPVGLSWKPTEMIEVFFQLIPQVGIRILPSVNIWDDIFGSNLGIRFWL